MACCRTARLSFDPPQNNQVQPFPKAGNDHRIILSTTLDSRTRRRAEPAAGVMVIQLSLAVRGLRDPMQETPRRARGGLLETIVRESALFGSKAIVMATVSVGIVGMAGVRRDSTTYYVSSPTAVEMNWPFTKAAVLVPG